MKHSGRYIEIDLDPFYQKLLRHHFDEEEIVFHFPKNHLLQNQMVFLIAKQPADYKHSPKTGKENFCIGIPYTEHRSPDYWNYMSDTSKANFVNAIKEFCKFIINQEIIESRNKSIPRKMIVDKLIENYQLEEFGADRIEKAYSRFLRGEINRKYHRTMNVKKMKKIS